MGDLNNFKTYEEFEAAVKKQVEYITELSAVGTVISQRVHRDYAPKPLMSIMYEGTMESGRDVSAGGAMYNWGPGLIWSGLATYADSMAAIKKLVYDDKNIRSSKSVTRCWPISKVVSRSTGIVWTRQNSEMTTIMQIASPPISRDGLRTIIANLKRCTLPSAMARFRFRTIRLSAR